MHYAEINFLTTENALDKLNNPTLIFGSEKRYPYILMFLDNIGTSPLQGGTTSIFGYTYNDDKYGSQLAIKYNYNTPKYRLKNGGVGSEWKELISSKDFTDRTIIGGRSIMTGNANQPLGYYYNEQRKLLEFYLNGVSIGSVNII